METRVIPLHLLLFVRSSGVDAGSRTAASHEPNRNEELEVLRRRNRPGANVIKLLTVVIC